MADLVVGVGPKLTEAFRKYLAGVKNIKMFLSSLLVFLMTFQVFNKFLRKENGASVLVFGRGDAEDFKLKGI